MGSSHKENPTGFLRHSIVALFILLSLTHQQQQYLEPAAHSHLALELDRFNLTKLQQLFQKKASQLAV